MRTRANLIPYIFFIISGACGLVYEVTWARYLALFLGNTTLAHMCVLAAFMGGLALGSILIGRVTARFRRPLAVYGILELVIGLYAVASPAIIGATRSFMLSSASGMQPGSASWLGLRLLVSVLVLLLPTFLMGGTFPILMEYFQPRSSSSEDKSEWLYLVNCSGAVVGSLLAGFRFIPNNGLQHTLLRIGAMNAALGICAIALAVVGSARVVAPREEQAKTGGVFRHPLAMPVYIAIAASGLASMIYELVWIRIFAVTLGSSTYSFTLMLSAFITGISLGSLAVGVVPRLRKNPLVSFALAEFAIAVAVLLTIPMYERLPYIFWKWASLLNRTSQTYALFNLAKYSLCFSVMALPTFFFGMTLPLAIKTITHRDENIGRDAGFVYGANTLGTLIGSLVTGLVLIRFMGLRHSLEFAIAVNELAAILLLSVSKLSYKRAAVGTVCAVVLGLMMLVPKWNPMSFVVGSFRFYTQPPATWSQYASLYPLLQTQFYREDDDGIVAVTWNKLDLSLYINGKADASSYSDLPTQVLLGQLPMFFKPDARDALVVGLGSGVTANSVLTHPDAAVDCVEISPAVVDAAECFSEANGSVYANDRFHLIREDARSYVAATRKKYDIVSSEPSNPWIAGIGNLFSVEYYHEVDRILKPGGVMAQWIQGYEISDPLILTIIRTVRRVFPNVYIFRANGSDTKSDFIILASRDPLSPDYKAMQERLKSDLVSEDLDRISVDSVAALLGRQMFGPESAEALSGSSGVINSDDHPVLEFYAPKAQYMNSPSDLFIHEDRRLTPGTELFISQYLGGKPLDRATAKSLIRAYSDRRVTEKRLLYPIARYYVSKWPDDAATAGLYALLSGELDHSGARKAAMAIPGNQSDPVTSRAQAECLSNDLISAESVYTPQDFTPALRLLDKALDSNPGSQSLQSLKDKVINLVR